MVRENREGTGDACCYTGLLQTYLWGKKGIPSR
jgi:hypothetical protein